MTLPQHASILLSLTALAASCASSGSSEPLLTYNALAPAGATSPSSQEDKPKTVVGKGLEAGVDAGKGLLSLPGRAVTSFMSGEYPDLSAGTQELGFSGNLNFTDDTAYNFDLSYGYFFKQGWEVGLTANAFGQEDFNLGAGLFTEYNWVFDKSKWVPYLGGAVKWARVSTSETSDSSAVYGGEVGLKYFIRSGVSIFSGVNFDWAPSDVFGIGDELKDSAQNVNFGIRFYL